MMIMNGNIKGLTGLRGFAVLFVILSHSNKAGFRLFDSIDFSGSGRYGVFIFFVLSSYLLTKQFLDLNEDINYINYFIKYLIKRILRIYPLFIGALSVYYALNQFGYVIWKFDLRDLFLNLLLHDGVGVFWAIPVEFQYYFIIPLVSFVLLKYKNNFFSVTILSFSFIILYSYFVKSVYKPNITPFLAVFYMGSFLAYLQKAYEGKKFTKRENLKVKFYLNFICLLVILCYIIIIPKFYGYIVGRNISIGYFHHEFYFFGFLSSVLIFTVINSDGIANKLFSSYFFNFIGNISFSMYLGHYIVLAGISKFSHFLFPSISFILFLLLTTIFSYFSYMFIEKPLYALKHKIIIPE